jgi:hypothetical protein
VDKASLVVELIEDGKRLIEALDAAKFDVKAAMWFYLPDTDEWRLIIASPFVDNSGPMKAYEFIQKEMEKLSPALGIKLRNIAVVSPQDRLISLMRLAIGTGPTISGIRFTQNVINNVLIEDAFIYRMM